MALNLDERYPGRANGKTLAYPQGSFKNRTSPNSQDGTYLEQDWANDWGGFFQSLLKEAGIAANGVVDTAQASQYYDALIAAIRSQDASETQKGVLEIATTAESQALTADDVVITPKKLMDSGAVFPGEVRTFAGPVANVPDGWLPCNGATISRTTYSRLFAVIGTTYGDGDGSTTFNIPDLRGEFIRGLDNGRGVDAGRSLGSAQLDQMQRITGQIAANATGWTGQLPGALRAYDAGSKIPAGNSGGTAWRGLEFDSAFSPNARTSATTDGETRPRNVAMNYIIKY